MMEKLEPDFDNFFRRLSELPIGELETDELLSSLAVKRLISLNEHKYSVHIEIM